jgi:hypothetical protein
VAFQVLALRILRRALPLAVIVYHQITREAHQPVLQVALFRVVLFERAIDADENFLRQIFRRVCARGEAIGEIVDTAGIERHDLLPRRAIARATSPD